MPFETMWIELDSIMYSEIRRQRQILYPTIYIWKKFKIIIYNKTETDRCKGKTMVIMGKREWGKSNIAIGN